MSILLLVTAVRVYCCTQKMLKNIQTDETLGFFVAFLSLVAFQLEGARALYPPLAVPMSRGAGPE